MNKRSRLIVIAIAAVAVLGVALPVAVERTSAAWTDAAVFSATATAGTWAATPRFSCAPLDPTSTATCTIVQRQWDFSGNNYTFGFHVSFSTGKHFPWVATFNLASSENAFAGYPVPAGAWWTEWKPTTFSPWNVCTLSSTADLPILVFSSSDKNQGNFGFSTSAQNGGRTVEELACN